VDSDPRRRVFDELAVITVLLFVGDMNGFEAAGFRDELRRFLEMAAVGTGEDSLRGAAEALPREDDEEDDDDEEDEEDDEDEGERAAEPAARLAAG